MNATVTTIIDLSAQFWRFAERTVDVTIDRCQKLCMQQDGCAYLVLTAADYTGLYECFAMFRGYKPEDLRTVTGTQVRIEYKAINETVPREYSFY